MTELCVIVGAGPGVSMGVARRFQQEGFRIALVSRNQENVEALAEQLGQDALGFTADASSEQSLVQVFEKIESTLGAPSVMVYNAAAIARDHASEISSERLIESLRINVVGAMICAQQVIPAMKAQGNGTILFTGGGLSLYPSPEYASLSMGKAGIRALTYILGAELAEAGIQVATVTIAGSVQPETHFDPDSIAAYFWRLHAHDRHEREHVYR